MVSDQMAKSVSKLMNLGSKSAQALDSIGVCSEDDLRKLGVVDAYRRLKHANPKGVSLNMLYAMQGALMNIHWNQVSDEIKEDLRRRVG